MFTYFRPYTRPPLTHLHTHTHVFHLSDFSLVCSNSYAALLYIFFNSNTFHFQDLFQKQIRRFCNQVVICNNNPFKILYKIIFAFFLPFPTAIDLLMIRYGKFLGKRKTFFSYYLLSFRPALKIS